MHHRGPAMLFVQLHPSKSENITNVLMERKREKFSDEVLLKFIAIKFLKTYEETLLLSPLFFQIK
jgi:hypothetical protein